MSKCLVASCDNLENNNNCTFYKLTEKRYVPWMRAIGRNPRESFLYEPVICSDHFLPDDYEMNGVSMSLKESAVPILILKPNLPIVDRGPSWCISVDQNDGTCEGLPTTYQRVGAHLKQYKNSSGMKHKKANTVNFHIENTFPAESDLVNCRTCKDNIKDNFQKVTEICWSDRTLRSIITQLIPQMEDSLLDEDCICEICSQLLVSCVKFIEKCLEIEGCMKRQQGKQLSSYTDDEITVDLNGHNTLSRNQVMQPLDSISSKQTEIEPSNHSGMQEQAEASNSFLVQEGVEASINLSVQKGIDPSNNLSIQELIEQSNIFSIKHEIGTVNSLHNTAPCISPRSDSSFEDKEAATPAVLSEADINTIPTIPGIFPELNFAVSVHQPEGVFSDLVANFIASGVNVVQCINESSATTRSKRVILFGTEGKNAWRRFRCRTCFKEFLSEEAKKMHLKIHPPYVCDKCGRVFVDSLTLTFHNQSSHSIESTYLCELCGKCFKTKDGMRQHKKTHVEVKEYKCEKCPNKSFKNHSILRVHIKRSHMNAPKIRCLECNKVYANGASFRLHMQLKHINKKRHICVACGIGFSRNDYYKRHIHRFHTQKTGRKKYEGKKRTYYSKPEDGYDCKFCKKKYDVLQNLKIHLQAVHTNLLRFKCPLCDLTFSTVSSKARHVKQHKFSPGNIRCHVCFKWVNSQEELEAHQSTHRRPKRHKCHNCEESFARKYMLLTHMLEKHAGESDIKKEEEIMQDALKDYI